MFVEHPQLKLHIDKEIVFFFSIEDIIIIIIIIFIAVISLNTRLGRPQLLRLGMESVLKIVNKKSLNKLMNHKVVYRTAPATPGLLKMSMCRSVLLPLKGSNHIVEVYL